MRNFMLGFLLAHGLACVKGNPPGPTPDGPTLCDRHQLPDCGADDAAPPPPDAPGPVMPDAETAVDPSECLALGGEWVCYRLPDDPVTHCGCVLPERT